MLLVLLGDFGFGVISCVWFVGYYGFGVCVLLFYFFTWGLKLFVGLLLVLCCVLFVGLRVGSCFLWVLFDVLGCLWCYFMLMNPLPSYYFEFSLGCADCLLRRGGLACALWS